MNNKIDQQIQKIKNERKDRLRKINLIKILKDEMLPELLKTETSLYLKEMSKQ